MIVTTNILSNSLGYSTKEDYKWNPLITKENYIPDNIPAYQKSTGKKYNSGYSASYYPANTKDTSYLRNQQYVSMKYQPNYQEMNINAGYITPQQYQFPLATQPNYQYTSYQVMPNTAPKSKVAPQYYYINTPRQTSALNYDQNIYQTVAATNQYQPVANNGYYYNTNAYSSEPQHNNYMYYVTDEYKIPESKMERSNNGMYNLGYEQRIQRPNQYDVRYNQQTAANEQVYYVYMPAKELSPPPMYYMSYVN